MEKRTFGEAVRELREARGLTITELANLSGCTFNNIKAIESSGQEPRRPLADAICLALKVRHVLGDRAARKRLEL